MIAGLDWFVFVVGALALVAVGFVAGWYLKRPEPEGETTFMLGDGKGAWVYRTTGGTQVGVVGKPVEYQTEALARRMRKTFYPELLWVYRQVLTKLEDPR